MDLKMIVVLILLHLQSLNRIGELSEWPNEQAWKVCILARVSRVRISHSPQTNQMNPVNFAGFFYLKLFTKKALMRRIFIKIKRNKKQAMFFMAFLTLLNTVLHSSFVGDMKFYETLLAMSISFPILSFILGLIPALIPIKKLNYLRRWLTYSYLWLFIFHCLFLVAFTFIGLANFVNYMRSY